MRFAYLLWMLALLAALIGPIQAQSPTGSPPMTARILMPTPDSLDPAQASRNAPATQDVLENLFIGLTRLDSRSGTIEPWLAESWELLNNGLTWRFTLRGDVQWVRHNAESGAVEALRPVQAVDFVTAIHRACQASSTAPLQRNLYIIAGCRTFANPNSNDPLDPFQMIGVRAISETVLEIDLLFPAAYFLTLTSQPEFRPLPAEYLSSEINAWPQPDSLVTSGAWAVQAWDASGMQLIPNPFWPLEVSGNLEAVSIRFSATAAEIPTQFDAESDFARLESRDFAALSAEQAALLQGSDGARLYILGFAYNQQTVNSADNSIIPLRTPLDNPLVRQALAFSLDREALSAAVFGDSAQAATRFTPRSVIASPSVGGAPFDVEAAQSLLSNAGYPNCGGMPPLTMAVNERPEMVALAQNIVLQWQQNLGCTFETFPIVQLSSPELFANAHNTLDITTQSRYPLWILSWIGDYPDAQAWVGDALHCDYGYFRVGRPCDSADALLNQAAASNDIALRFGLYNQVETAFFGTGGSFPLVPLVMLPHGWLQGPRLEGVARFGPQHFDRWILRAEDS